jgi:DNA-binding IclR family transcriptional regulator
MIEELKKRGRPPLPKSRAATAAAETPVAREVRIRQVPAVRRAAAILHLLARHGEGLTVSRLARELEIIPSTCLHIMRELTGAHLVAFEPKGKVYRLGLEILSLANQLSSHDVFIQSAQPRLGQFAHDYGVSASAQQREGDEVVVVAAVVASEGLASPLGRRVPCLSAAAGRLYAASTGWTDAQLRAHFERVRWQNRPDFAAWMDEVRLANETGYAIDEGQFRLGVSSIAAGIADRHGHVQHTISINVISAQMDDKRRSNFIHALKLMAAEITSACQ